MEKQVVKLNSTDMKSSGKIFGLLLLLLISGSGYLNAQSVKNDTARMNKPWLHYREMSDMRHMGMGHNADSMKQGWMRHGFNSMYMRGMRPYMYDGWGWIGPMDRFGFPPPRFDRKAFMWNDTIPRSGHSTWDSMRGMGHESWYWMGPSDYFRMRSMGPMSMNHFGPGHFGAERQRIESIPNLTDKQKKEIADLRTKNQAEIKKFRDETIAKIKIMREAHRKDLMNLLTDEQKKYLESGSDNNNTGSSKQK
jgi:hypothetical protein